MNTRKARVNRKTGWKRFEREAGDLHEDETADTSPKVRPKVVKKNPRKK